MTGGNGVLTAKLDRVFGLLDSDGDGQLVPTDLSVLASKLAEAFGAEAEQHKISKLEDTLLALWETDLCRMDTNNDGVVDREEFSVGIRSAFATEPEAFLERFNAMVEAWMDICDTNGNGLIEPEEYVRMYSLTLGVPTDDLAAAFRRLDHQGRGYLDLDDIRQASREYYTSDEPDTPGNWLFGPM